MHVDALRWADRWVGLPACWILTALRFLGGGMRCRAASAAAGLRRVLVVKLSEMGSTVLALPAIEELQRRAPEVEIHVVVFEENRAIFDVLGRDRGWHVHGIATGSVREVVRSGLRVVGELRRLGMDAALDMDFFSRFAAALAYVACRGARVGFDRYGSEGLGRGNLLTHPVLYSAHVHTADAFVALVRTLLGDGGAGRPLWRGRVTSMDRQFRKHEPSEEAKERVRALLREAGLAGATAGRRLVLVNPNSSGLFPLRRWPIERYGELCRRLIEEHDDIEIAVTGTGAEEQDARRVIAAAGSGRCVSLAGRTTFEELLALYSMAAGMVTNDSGPGHFAALVGMPAVVLFGPETPRLYGPLGRSWCLHAGYACSPCVTVHNAKKSPCGRSLCLEAIGVDEVLDAVRESILGVGGRGV